MIRRRHLAAPLAPVAALLLAACAAAPPPPSATMAPAADYSTTTMITAAPVAPPNDLEGQIAALGAAEAELDRAIRRSPLAQSDRVDAEKKPGREVDKEKAEERRVPREAPPSEAPRRPWQADGQKDFRASIDDSGVATGDPCATACSALSSMERAAKHLCDLTGDSDARCDNARTRVSGATARVNASCPACSHAQ